MNSPVWNLLNRLDGVKEMSKGRWLAKCPAHADKRPSLSVREGDTGAVLVKCWTGCTVSEIATAAGLELTDLFPPREVDSPSRPHRRERIISAADGLRLLDFEADVICIVADMIEKGKPLDQPTRDALVAARHTIRNVYREALL
jgi:hypothetical protein